MTPLTVPVDLPHLGLIPQFPHSRVKICATCLQLQVKSMRCPSYFSCLVCSLKAVLPPHQGPSHTDRIFAPECAVASSASQCTSPVNHHNKVVPARDFAKKPQGTCPVKLISMKISHIQSFLGSLWKALPICPAVTYSASAKSWFQQSRALKFRAGPWGWGPWHEVDPTVAQAGTVQLAKVMIYRRYKCVYKIWVPHKVCLLFVSSRTRHLPSALLPFWQENPFRMEVSVFNSKSLVAGKPMTSYCNEWCNLCIFFRLHKTPSNQKLDVHQYNGIPQKARSYQKESRRQSSVKSQGHVATCCGF